MAAHTTGGVHGTAGDRPRRRGQAVCSAALTRSYGCVPLARIERRRRVAAQARRARAVAAKGCGALQDYRPAQRVRVVRAPVRDDHICNRRLYLRRDISQERARHHRHRALGRSWRRRERPRRHAGRRRRRGERVLLLRAERAACAAARPAHRGVSLSGADARQLRQRCALWPWRARERRGASARRSRTRRARAACHRPCVGACIAGASCSLRAQARSSRRACAPTTPRPTPRYGAIATPSRRARARATGRCAQSRALRCWS